MSHLLVVSNRLPVMRGGGRGTQVPAGGLASAVLAALQRTRPSLWLGWSGKIVSKRGDTTPSRALAEGVPLIGIPLTQAEARDYYRGFCNGALWPLLHCFQSRVHPQSQQEACYRTVQGRFATALQPLLRRDSLVWVHDYHLLLLGRELRRRGWRGRLGFFLHTPFPPLELWQLLPDPLDFLRALLEYDVVGFQTPGFLDNYVYACCRQLEARWDGCCLHTPDRTQHVGVYPVGIDPEDFAPSTGGGDRPSRRGELARVVRGRRLILGVDRLDYTKGIPERILAFESFVLHRPEWRKRVSFVQIASPSRTDVVDYAEQKARVEALVGRVNAEQSEHDWVPIRYLYRSYGRDQLARFYREANVGLVTPLRDGMNLVASEFVAAQAPDDPGVLVLSRTAGASEHLQQAVLVNPFMPADVARGIEAALTMPLEERQQRHAALLQRVRAETAAEWAHRFVADLAGDEPQRDDATQLSPRLRSHRSGARAW